MDAIDDLFIVKWVLAESLHVCVQVFEDELV